MKMYDMNKKEAAVFMIALFFLLMAQASNANHNMKMIAYTLVIIFGGLGVYLAISKMAKEKKKK